MTNLNESKATFNLNVNDYNDADPPYIKKITTKFVNENKTSYIQRGYLVDQYRLRNDSSSINRGGSSLSGRNRIYLNDTKTTAN